MAVSAAGLVIFLVWAMLAQVEEVTRGQGKVIPSSKSQLIQASEPANIRDILVRAGQRVRKGELLIRLDDTQSSSALGQIQAEDRSLTARAARLGQEASGQAFDCPEDIKASSPDACMNEAKLQEIRGQAQASKRSAAMATVEQRRRELAEAQATLASLRSSLVLAQKQVSLLEPMAAKSIVPETELLQARRDATDIQGRMLAAEQAVSRTQAGIAEAQATASETVYQFRQDAQDERNQLEGKLAVIHESGRGAEGKLERTELRSPVDGVVNDVQVTTLGGFVNAGQKIMEVVPVGDKLLVEARVKPNDIAFIRVGQEALVKVTAYDFSIYGGLTGKVVQVAADSVYDEATKQAYFTVIVETQRSFLNSGGRRLPITPGMICNVDITTGRKSVLDYILKPVLKARYEALRER